MQPSPREPHSDAPPPSAATASFANEAPGPAQSGSADGQATGLFHPDARTVQPTPGRQRPRTPTVPGYSIIEELGRGGMGVVYKARQEKADRVVALKMILSGAQASERDRLRFQMEAEAVAALSHPNIVQVYEVGETAEGFAFFSLEYVGGGTLAQRLRAGALPAAEAAAMLEALALAMDRAHEQGIVHRDLKPQNILLNPVRGAAASGSGLASAPITGASSASRAKQRSSGPSSGATLRLSDASSDASLSTYQPKISDFGLAKRLDADDGVTQSGDIIGTPAYMAPEQAFGQTKHVGPAADVYALGAILYECLTGRPPFKGITTAETLDQVRTREPLPPQAIVKDLPRDLATICLHCLHKDPQRRYVSAAALAEDLRRFREGAPISVRPVGDLERAWRWCRRNPKWAAMIAALALLLCSVTGVSLYAYFTVAAMNEDIQAKSEAIKKEAEEKELQRKEAVIAQKKAEEQTELAQQRQADALRAVGLFATDARIFCEDALVPGESRALLFGVLINELKNQADPKNKELSIDALRNKAFMHLTIGQVYTELGTLNPVKEWLDKGLKDVDLWLKLAPKDPLAWHHRAALLHQSGAALTRQFKDAEARPLYTEALEIRRKIVDAPEIDKIAVGRGVADLADTLDALLEFEESLPLRERAYKLQTDKSKQFDFLNAWCNTAFKAAAQAKEYSAKKDFLLRAVAMSADLEKLRKESRPMLLRWAKALREIGDLEINHGNAAEARKHFDQLTGVAKKLATNAELVEPLRSYARSWYMIGEIEKKLGYPGQAREHFERSRQIREELLREYKAHPLYQQLRIDLLFSRVQLGEHVKISEEVDKLGELYVRVKGVGYSYHAYRMACVYSLCILAVADVRAGETLTAEDKALQARYRDNAFRLLDHCFANGNPDFFLARTDADLAPLRDDPRFEEILAKYAKK